MKCVIADQVVLSRAPDGPLATHVGAFAQSRLALGYRLQSTHRQVLLAADFSHWLLRHSIALRQVRADHGSRYLRDRARRARPALGDAAAIRHLIGFLRHAGVLAPEKLARRRVSSMERHAQAYARHLRDARALAETTVGHYVPFIRAFLTDRFGDGSVRLNRLRAADVVGYVQRLAPRLHMKSAKLLTTVLRSFLRYARQRGAVVHDLAAAVPVVAAWSMTGVPRAIGAGHVRQLLASLDRRTAVGRRDHAIVLVLARLGLRSGEVARLDLEDIDWGRGQISVRGKRGHRAALPLPADVGAAIAAYLRDGRPSSPSRRVFLRSRAPLSGFAGPSGIGSIIRHALLRAEIQATTMGAHQFRHGLATEMLRRGASLAEIGEILRHQSPQTTAIYAKVDLRGLRPLALPWPGGAR